MVSLFYWLKLSIGLKGQSYKILYFGVSGKMRRPLSATMVCQFVAGVIYAGGTPWNANVFDNLQQKIEITQVVYQRTVGKMGLMKNQWGIKSCDTVQCSVVVYTFCRAWVFFNPLFPCWEVCTLSDLCVCCMWELDVWMMLTMWLLGEAPLVFAL